MLFSPDFFALFRRILAEIIQHRAFVVAVEGAECCRAWHRSTVTLVFTLFATLAAILNETLIATLVGGLSQVNQSEVQRASSMRRRWAHGSCSPTIRGFLVWGVFGFRLFGFGV